MSKVTSKRQVTIPKRIADRYGIEPGSEVYFEPAGDVVRLRMGTPATDQRLGAADRLALFDAASERQRERDEQLGELVGSVRRGWTREELYDRGLPR